VSRILESPQKRPSTDDDRRWKADFIDLNWSGREDLNLRPLGPEPSFNATISECFVVFWPQSSNWVATASRSVPQFRRPPPPIDDTSGGGKMISAMNYQDRIVRDPRIVGGEPILKGTRVTLKTVLASLAEGATTAEILADFPTLSEEDVRAVIAFAAGSAQEDMPLIETPIKR
jgi:uncharacterized protein (DUF433 family)